MKMRIWLSVLTFCLSFHVLAQSRGNLVSSAVEVKKDIKQTLGIVPTFLSQYPDHALEGIWQEFKTLQLSKTAIPFKDTELIGLGVAAQIPCKYCVEFHTMAVKLHGGSKAEINEALASAASTRKWSTFLYGTQIDMGDFRSDVRKMVRRVQDNMNKDPDKRPAMINITNAESVYKDAENIFGFVPEFVKQYPKAFLPGAWKLMSAIDGTNMALSPKLKSLISLAVASQVPCQYCVHMDSEFAKINGATTEEIQEAILMAGMVRHWSTFLNGIQMDEEKFRQETRQIISNARRQTQLSE